MDIGQSRGNLWIRMTIIEPLKRNTNHNFVMRLELEVPL